MLPLGVNVTRGPGFASSVAVSPDGRTLVVAGMSGEDQRLYRRPLDQLEATPLDGTERGSSPFFSPDGAWIGFFADGRLKRIPAAGGAAVDIVTTPGFPAGASWGPDNRIVFAFGNDSRLYSVDAGGGNAEPLSGIEASRHPEVLPDGKTLLFESRGWIHALDRTTGRQARLVQGTAPRYAMGHIILSRGTTLLAAPVNLARYEMTGQVVPLFQGVAVELPGSGGGRHYAISNNGTLAYVPAPDAYELVLVGRDGTERLLTEQQRSFENPRFSPDGRHVVVAATRRDGEPADVWLHEIDGKTPTRLTFDGGRAPVWTPDGSGVTYSHLGEGGGIYSKRADGGDDASQILPLKSFHWLVGWTPDRRTLAYGTMEGTPSSIMSYSNRDSRRVVGPGSTWGGRLSRDGRWLAYYSLDSGNFEVYVTPFPESGPRWLIAGGTDPSWAPGDSELYYRSGSRLMAAQLDKTSGIRAISHRVVIEPFLPPLYDDYDIHPDGRTLVMVRPAGNTRGREVTMILDWFQELGRLVQGS
jgi:serine/threonine-protein kinase